MPRGKKDKRPQFELKGFVPCDLDKSTKDQAKQWVADNLSGFAPKIESLVTDGYKISFSFDRVHDCFQASCTCTDPENDDYGFCLTARAPDVWSAVGVLLYKHFIVLDGDWSSRTPTASSGDKWA